MTLVKSPVGKTGMIQSQQEEQGTIQFWWMPLTSQQFWQPEMENKTTQQTLLTKEHRIKYVLSSSRAPQCALLSLKTVQKLLWISKLLQDCLLSVFSKLVVWLKAWFLTHLSHLKNKKTCKHKTYLCLNNASKIHLGWTLPGNSLKRLWAVTYYHQCNLWVKQMRNLLTKTANETVYLSALEKINKDSLCKLWLHPKLYELSFRGGRLFKTKRR